MNKQDFVRLFCSSHFWIKQEYSNLGRTTVKSNRDYDATMNPSTQSKLGKENKHWPDQGNTNLAIENHHNCALFVTQIY